MNRTALLSLPAVTIAVLALALSRWVAVVTADAVTAGIVPLLAASTRRLLVGSLVGLLGLVAVVLLARVALRLGRARSADDGRDAAPSHPADLPGRPIRHRRSDRDARAGGRDGGRRPPVIERYPPRRDGATARVGPSTRGSGNGSSSDGRSGRR